MVVDKYGRPWEEFDSIRAQALLPHPFTLVSEDGVPLCGVCVDGKEPQHFTAAGWRTP